MPPGDADGCLLSRGGCLSGPATGKRVEERCHRCPAHCGAAPSSASRIWNATLLDCTGCSTTGTTATTTTT